MAPRRTHKKSRNGCRECKRRHLKCNEQFPCSNCASHGIACSFVPPGGPALSHDVSRGPQGSPAGLSPAAPTLSAVSTHRSPSMPTPPESGYSGNSALLDLLSDTLHDVPAVPKENWVRDLELMHHFCTVTADTLAIREDMRYTWRVIVPTEGYSNEFVMHGILATAAIHRASLFPSRRSIYLECSDYHQACGLRTFRAILSSPLKRENWQAIFCFASMLVVWVLAMPARSADGRLPSPIANVIELFSVIRGIQAILEPFQHPLKHSSLTAFVHGVWTYNDDKDWSLSSASESLLPSDTMSQLGSLRGLVESSNLNPDKKEDHMSAISTLELSVKHMAVAGLRIERYATLEAINKRNLTIQQPIDRTGDLTRLHTIIGPKPFALTGEFEPQCPRI
ncbi:Zn(II)2Cys6 transcription factor [Aspergillus melleus]|uniref:Zn(II)2Cys6 transcription factor n=1 Tax=Aspergillus melleus TaxID=138277 RepID=UPI001E8EB20F|nr:uncharacterized protein LDX57_000268 [Aspergillus melleus]KAH8422514.1 hypothetical protein LDX57_000268 [Aspergillus melleus]